MVFNKKEIINIEGFGQKSYDNLILSIEKSKRTTLSRFIFSLGLRYVGENNSELLANYFQSKENFKSLISSEDLNLELENIDGLGNKATNSFSEYFKNKDQLNEAISILNLLDIEIIKDDNRGSNESILFTGTLSELSRDRAKDLAKKKGFKIASNVSSKLNIPTILLLTNSEGSSPVISAVIVAVPKLPVKSKVQVPGFLFSKVSSATPVDLTESTPPEAVLIE